MCAATSNTCKLLETSTATRAYYNKLQFPAPARRPKMTRATRSVVRPPRRTTHACRWLAGALYLMKLPIQRKPSP